MWLRIITTIVLFVLIFVFISPIKVIGKITYCDKQLIALALALVPLYVLTRFLKWYYLVRGVDCFVGLKTLFLDYLWGMAIGLVTPGHVGELVRLKNLSIPKKNGLSLFVVEKIIEVSVLVVLCVIAISVLKKIPFITIIIGFMFVAAIFALIFKIACQYSWIDIFRRNLNRESCFICISLTFFCFIIFFLQMFIVLKSMDIIVGFNAVLLFPIIMLGNIIPVSIGGFGVREIIAITLLSRQYIPGEAAMACVTVTALFDLVIPAIIGVVTNLSPRLSYAKSN